MAVSLARVFPPAPFVGLLVGGLITLFSGNPAHAGPNEDGVLILHMAEVVNPTCDPIVYCGKSDLYGCAGAKIREDDDLGFCSDAIFLLAAFPESASPRVSSVSFGVEVAGSGDFFFILWGECGDSEEPGALWPGENSGTKVSWAEPQEAELVEVYWFVGYQYYYIGDPFTLAATPHPTLGGQFEDDNVPPEIDPVADYGVFGFRTDGYLPACAPAGACCLPNGECALASVTRCAELAGLHFGVGSVCEPDPCADFGACCLSDGTCLLSSPEDCFGGEYFGDGTVCEPNSCLEPGACCDAGGLCTLVPVFDCPHEDWRAGDSCEPNPCEQPVGACCLPDASCVFIELDVCVESEGAFQGSLVPCTPELCGGACCSGDLCQILPEADCIAGGGEFVYVGDGVDCAPSPCVVGACCAADGSCEVLPPPDCVAADATYLGAGTDCDPGVCSSVVDHVFVIDPAGTGDFRDIEAAVVDEITGPETVIELRDGVFSGEGNRNVHFQGSATIRSQSGDPRACVIDVAATTFDPARAFFVEWGLLDLSGVTIRGGNAEPVVDGSPAGGAIYLSTGDYLDVENCVFESNRGIGGAIYIPANCTVSLTGSHFFQNHTQVSAGALYIESSDVEIRDCLFEANYIIPGSPGPGYGGAIKCGGNSQVDIWDSTFRGGLAVYGGAVWYSAPSDLDSMHFHRCEFENNEASSRGGAIFAQEYLEFFDCSFVANRSPEGRGGTMYLSQADVLVRGCTILDGEAGQGGGMYLFRSEPEIEQTLIAFCSDYGVYCDESQPLLRCTDIFGNEEDDWLQPCLDFFLGVLGNIEADPLLCDDRRSVSLLSPLLPGQHPDGGDCGRIGSFEPGCPAADLPGSDDAIPTRLRISAPAPNPTSGTVTLMLELPREAGTRIRILDVSGRELGTRDLGLLSAGSHSVEWDLSGGETRLARGVYYLEAEAGGEREVRKVVLR